MTASPTKVNGTARHDVPVLGPTWQIAAHDGNATVWEKNPVPTEPTLVEAIVPTSTVDLRAEAEAEAIRARADALRIEAEGNAKAAEIMAKEQAEQLRLENEKQQYTNERSRMKLERDQADQAAYLAKKAAEEAASKTAKEKADKAAAEKAKQEADREAEQQRTESLWKWGARAIYAVGLVIAAPIQFLAFWDPARKFLVAAPALLEGLALVLAFGAAWAVANRRDVMPYRIGIMIGALIAAGINLWHGLTDPAIGLNAGLIGALASLGGPVILMAYEHGIAQKADGIPSYRERRATDKAKAKEAAGREKAKSEKDAAAKKVADEKAEQQKRAEAEQKRRDDDRKANHPDVWEVADSIRSARATQALTEAIWAEAWLRVTGSKLVGVTPEIEELSRLAQARMQAATEIHPGDALSQVKSQQVPRAKRDPDAPDGRRNNGGIPPLRTPGDALPNSPIAKKQAALEQPARTAAND